MKLIQLGHAYDWRLHIRHATLPVPLLVVNPRQIGLQLGIWHQSLHDSNALPQLLNPTLSIVQTPEAIVHLTVDRICCWMIVQFWLLWFTGLDAQLGFVKLGIDLFCFLDRFQLRFHGFRIVAVDTFVVIQRTFGPRFVEMPVGVEP